MQICHLYHGHLAERISFQSKEAFLHFFWFSQKKNSTFRSERLIDSLCHDICYNLTNGQWKTPKHLLLGMSLGHIRGSSKVVTFLDRLGHCVSHLTHLELETAMCDSVKENDSNLEPAMCESVKENDSNLKSGAAKQAVITNFTAKYKEEKKMLVNYMWIICHPLMPRWMNYKQFKRFCRFQWMQLEM